MEHKLLCLVLLLNIFMYSGESFTFTKTDSSFLEFFPDWLPTSIQGASFKFKTKEANALLYLHHFANKTKDEPDYLFWFELQHGQLVANHQLDSHLETFSLNTKLNDDKWHTVNYTKDQMAGELLISVDETTVGLSLNVDDVISKWLQSLQSMSAVSFGGLSLRSSAMVSKEFGHITGCIENIYFITDKMQGWKELDFTTQEGTILGCVDLCASENPCINGRCVNSYASTFCDCFGSGYHGNKCEIRGNAVVTFQAFNFLQLSIFPSGNTMPMDENDINLSFKVGKEQLIGLLFYAAGTLPVETSLAIFIEDGRLVVNVKLGSSPNTFTFDDHLPVNDDKWHYVTFIHNDNIIEVQLDGQGYRQEVSDGDGLFHFDGEILIGGGENLNNLQGLNGQANFVGCLREIYVDRFNVLEALSMNVSGLTFSGGHPIFQCRPVGYPPITFPTHESTLNLDGWKSGSMNLMFDVKTDQGDGLLILVLLDIDKKIEGRIRMELVDTHLLVHMDVGTAPGQHITRNTLKSNVVINDTRWHSVALHLQDGVFTFVVDDIGSTLSYSFDVSASSSLYLGGGWRGQGKGIKGCVRHIVFQEEEVIAARVIDTSAANGILLNSCPVSNPCAAGDFVCQHGGRCSSESGGARCTCEGTRYVGAMCSYSKYKQSCAQSYDSGDHDSGVKELDLDGQGPLESTFVNCNYSTESAETAVEHNFADMTLVRDVHLSNLAFNISYRDMNNDQLAQLVRSSSTCKQYFSFICFEAPLLINRGWTVLNSASGRRLHHYNIPFATNCDLNAKEWNVDHGFITNLVSLPIVNMQFFKLPSVSGSEKATKGKLSLGSLQCSTDLKEKRGLTVTITRPQDYITLDTWQSNSLYFKFRTSVDNIVLFHQMSGEMDSYSLTAVLTSAFKLRLTLLMNGEIYDGLLEKSQPMTDGKWHTLMVERSLIDFRITMDFTEAFLNLPKGVILNEFTGSFLLGGMENSPKGTRGMTGCISDFTYNDEVVFLYDFYEHEDHLQIKAGCATACDSNPCQNGGSCIDQWETFVCKCAHPAHTGHDCSRDNTKDVVSFMSEGHFLEYEPNNTDILTSSLRLGFRTFHPNALILYARDKWNNFIQMELVDGIAFVFSFNSGMDIQKVVVNSSESTCPVPLSDRVLICNEFCQDDSDCSGRMKCCSTGCGTECVLPEAGYALNDGEWVEVNIERQSGLTSVAINGRRVDKSVPIKLLTEHYTQPFNEPETVMPDRDVMNNQGSAVVMQMLIGGAPDSMTSLPGLMGCIRGLIVKDQPWALQSLVRIMQRLFSSKAPSLQCVNHCAKIPCKNGGICTELWTSYHCNCTGTTYVGKTCEEEYGAQFKEDSVLSIPLQSKINMEQDRLEFGFSTDQPSGVLFYIRNGKNKTVHERLIISLNQGDLEAHIDLGGGSTVLRLPGPFNDTFRHAVVFKRFGNRVLFDVDNSGYEYQTLDPAGDTEFNDRELLVIGGLEKNATQYGLQGLQGYTGCLTGLSYNGKHPLETLFTSNPQSNDARAIHRQQCPMFEMSDVGTTETTTTKAKEPAMQRTPGPWFLIPAQGVTVTLPPHLADASTVNWILIAAVAGAAVVVLLFFLCCCCILRSDKGNKENMEETQHLVKPQDEVRVVHPVRQVAAEAKCLDAPPQQPSPPTSHTPIPKSSHEPSAIHSTSHPNVHQEHVAWGGLTVQGAGEKISSVDSLSDDAAFRQLEVEAGLAEKDTSTAGQGTRSEESQDLNSILQDDIMEEGTVEIDTVASANVPEEVSQEVDTIPVMTENEENLLQFTQNNLKADKADEADNVSTQPSTPLSESEETSV